ncbi:hypothetical protein ZWY2020_026922 [Hordeum vulgare]|nr:hypothetical protein ZWY2020_026922 [Hordeum vulgare]
MEIAMGAIGPLLPKLRELLMGELTMEKKVRKGIESLVTELKLMHAVLSKVAKVPADQLDEGVKIWAGNVKELSYQMEDIVDAFMVRVEDGGEPANPKNRVKKIVKKVKKLFKNGKDLHRISDALEEVVVQAKQLAELRQRYEQETRDTSSNTSVDPRMVALYTDVTELVGIEETRDQLINMLIGGDDWSKHPLKTVSIVGFGGLGKTTLARAAYDKIKLNFDCGAFVSVSQNPNIKKILKSILFELDKVKYADIYNVEREETHLIDELIEFLHEKRYLIIIDDIWDKEVWKLINIFPEDHEIRRDRLIWRWISEGFVYSEKKDISLYELGDSYFNELVNRNMIQPIDIGYDEKVNACRVHDMVLDLICSLSSEENFVTILDDTRRKMGNSEIKVRRLSIQNSKIDVDTTRMEHMRSVTVFSDNVVGKVLDISKFEVLRVLDLEGCKDVSDVRYVGNLLHLRYLGLRNTHVKDLPMEIGKLQFLLTLDLRGNLTSIEVLDELGLSEVDLDFVKELGHLTKLRVLRLDLDGFDESLGKALEQSIGNMDKLDSLDVDVRRGVINCLSEDWVPPPQLRRLAFKAMQSWFKTLPSWISPSSLPLLSYLEITVFEVRSEAIQLLGTLPALVYLKIMNHSVCRAVYVSTRICAKA